MIRAIRAAKPDIVFVMSYPNDSVAIVRAVNEIGVGDSVKLFGGGMVGLQFTPIMESLGSSLNGIVNYNSYVPGIKYPGIEEFLQRYAKRAAEAKVDPLGFYLPPFNYAIGQMLEQAITATKSLDHKALADYLRKNEMKTIVGPIRFGPDGEWANPRVVQAQFRGVVDKNMDQFRQPGKQVVLYPDAVQDRRRRRAVREGARRQVGAPRQNLKRRGSPRAVFLGVEPWFSFELLLEAILFGILLGCFYAAVSIGLSVSFGLLDVPHVAHPAIMVFGSYCTYLLGRYGLDPIVAGLVLMPLFFLLGMAIYRFYYETFEKRGTEAGVRGLAFFFGLALIIEVGLILAFGVDQRMVEAPYIGKSLAIRRDAHPDAHAGRVRRRGAADHRADAVPLAHLHRPGDQGGGAGRAGAAG